MSHEGNERIWKRRNFPTELFPLWLKSEAWQIDTVIFQFRLPREYPLSESRLSQNRSLSHRSRRLEIYIQRKTHRGRYELILDQSLAQNYISSMRKPAIATGRIEEDHSLDAEEEERMFPLKELLQMPGVLYRVEKEADSTLEWPLLSTALEMGLLEMMDRRKAQGIKHKTIY